MGGRSSKNCKKEGNATKDEPHSVDPLPQDECEAHPLAQPPPVPRAEVGTPQGK